MSELTNNAEIVCATCATYFGTGFSDAVCPICADDRQYVPADGQRWATPDAIAASHRIVTRRIGPEFLEMILAPTFAIGQRAILVESPSGNVLWDCLPLIDNATVEFIRQRGGLKAIAISHPHFYSAMNGWAAEFDCPVFIHRADENWIFNRGPRVEFWSGRELELWDGMRLINVGGHFDGSTILMHPSGDGTMLCGDSFVIAPSARHTAVMHSYPNRIPLPTQVVRDLRGRLDGLEFEVLHAWHPEQSILSGARRVVDLSLARYI